MNIKRNRAWRRYKSKVNKRRGMGSEKQWKPEKKWKMLYLRSTKLARAKQLGFDYPRKNTRQLLDSENDKMSNDKMSDVKKLLFICSKNQWRSPTGEKIWRNKTGFNARSAGTSPKARKTVSLSDIRWADIIFVMEEKHKNRLMAQFTRMLDYKPVYVLDIPDEYKFMDPELIEEIEARVVFYLNTLSSP